MSHDLIVATILILATLTSVFFAVQLMMLFFEKQSSHAIKLKFDEELW